MTDFTFHQIGVIRSPYKEKFAIPRQPGLVDDGGGELQLVPPYNQANAVRGLNQFSHLWIMFIFHQTMAKRWHPTVRPPRLGGNTHVGVFATRSTFRPNPVGLSLIELKGIRCQGSEVILELGSLDLVDGTPVVDIKPYLPFVENQPKARAGFAQFAPSTDMTVVFSSYAEQQLVEQQHYHPNLRRFIYQLLAQDPRPAWQKKSPVDTEYAVFLLEFNVRWRVSGHKTEVLSLDAC